MATCIFKCTCIDINFGRMLQLCSHLKITVHVHVLYMYCTCICIKMHGTINTSSISLLSGMSMSFFLFIANTLSSPSIPFSSCNSFSLSGSLASRDSVKSFSKTRRPSAVEGKSLLATSLLRATNQSLSTVNCDL